MKRIKTFEQYNNAEILNEGVITDIVNKYSGKLKELIKSALAKFSPEKITQMNAEVAPFKGMSYEQIKQELENRKTSNEDTANKVMNYVGLGLFSTFAASLATMIADNKWDFLHKVFNLHDVGGSIGMVLGVSFMAFILWLYCKMDMNEESYSDATKPSGVSDAERHSSSYIANQSRQRERNAGR